MRLLAVSALIATQWFGAASARSSILRACRSCRTTHHVWLGLLYLHYGHIVSLALAQRGAPGRRLHLPRAGFAAGVLPSPGASVSVGARTGLIAGLRPELRSVPDVAGGGCQAARSSCHPAPALRDPQWGCAVTG